MIVLDPLEIAWDHCDDTEAAGPITVFTPTHERVSQLLGPDGEPLAVPYERPALGFDLRPKRREAGE